MARGGPLSWQLLPFVISSILPNLSSCVHRHDEELAASCPGASSGGALLQSHSELSWAPAHFAAADSGSNESGPAAKPGAELGTQPTPSPTGGPHGAGTSPWSSWLPTYLGGGGDGWEDDLNKQMENTINVIKHSAKHQRVKWIACTCLLVLCYVAAANWRFVDTEDEEFTRVRGLARGTSSDADQPGSPGAASVDSSRTVSMDEHRPLSTIALTDTDKQLFKSIDINEEDYDVFEVDEADMVMVFPHRPVRHDSEGSGREDSSVRFSLATMAFHVVDWDDKVDGLAHARLVFHKLGALNKQTVDAELQKHFSEEMSLADYHRKCVEMLTKLLTSKLGCLVRRELSCDNDKVILKIDAFHHKHLGELAHSLGYPMPLSNTAYQMLEQKPKQNANGQDVRAFLRYENQKPQYYQPFREQDSLRILKSKLDAALNLDAFMEQGVLEDMLCPCEYKVVRRLAKTWGNKSYWWKLSSLSAAEQDTLRDHFGEQVAWMFVWQAHFTRALVVPAALGALVFTRRWFPTLPEMVERSITLFYGAFVIVWTAWFNNGWDRTESRIRQVWGGNSDARRVESLRTFRPELELSARIMTLKVFSDLLSLSIVVASTVCTLKLEQWRYGIQTSDHQEPPMVKLVSASCVSLQIMVIDFVWLRLSRVLVNCMNCRTQEQWNSFWAQRVFWPRLYNNLFPFVYIGVIKGWWIPGSCGDFDDACMNRLEMNLVIYFISRYLAQIVFDYMFEYVSRVQVKSSLSECRKHGRIFSYVQLQLTCFPYDEQLYLEDWLENVMMLAFVASFSVVLPAISFMSLLSSLLEVKANATRSLFSVRRPVPLNSSGIENWRDILAWVESIAVALNLGMAIFAMRPLRDQPLEKKLLLFVISQHVLLILKEAVKAKFAPVPLDVHECEEFNQDVLMKLSFSEALRLDDDETAAMGHSKTARTVDAAALGVGDIEVHGQLFDEAAIAEAAEMQQWRQQHLRVASALAWTLGRQPQSPMQIMSPGKEGGK